MVRCKYMKYEVFTLQSANKTIFHGKCFSTTWQTKFTNSESKFLSFPRYRHIRAPGKYACNAFNALQTGRVTGKYFRCTKSVPVTRIYCTALASIYRPRETSQNLFTSTSEIRVCSWRHGEVKESHGSQPNVQAAQERY